MQTTIERDGVEIAVTIEYVVHEAHRGRRDTLMGVPNAGPPLEPDEPAHIEIERVVGPDGEEIELTVTERNRIEDEINEQLSDLEYED